MGGVAGTRRHVEEERPLLIDRSKVSEILDRSIGQVVGQVVAV